MRQQLVAVGCYAGRLTVCSSIYVLVLTARPRLVVGVENLEVVLEFFNGERVEAILVGLFGELILDVVADKVKVITGAGAGGKHQNQGRDSEYTAAYPCRESG